MLSNELRDNSAVENETEAEFSIPTIEVCGARRPPAPTFRPLETQAEVTRVNGFPHRTGLTRDLISALPLQMDQFSPDLGHDLFSKFKLGSSSAPER